jgi:acylphosphatase
VTVRARVIVRGRVQGVFFRDSVRGLAREAGVAGSIRNRDDGAVEAVFEGAPEDVSRLLDYCRSGPPGAQVESVEELEEAPRGEHGFAVH